MEVNGRWGLEGILSKLWNPRRTGIAVALAAGLLSTAASAQWTPPTDLTELNSGNGEQVGSMSSDGLTLYYSHDETRNYVDIWCATRPDTISPWENPRPITEVNDVSAVDDTPVISGDGLTLYFTSNRGGGSGGWDIYFATRADTTSPFSAPQPLSEVNSPDDDGMGSISCDGRTIYFSSSRPGGIGLVDIYTATRPDIGLPFDPPVNLIEVNSDQYDTRAFISADDLELYIARQPPLTDNTDIYLATRPDPSVPFSTPIPLTEVNTSDSEQDAVIGFDGTELFFTSNRGGSTDIWKSTRATGTGNCVYEPPPVEDCVDGKWGQAIPVWELNTAEDESAPSISKDGTTLYWNVGTTIWNASRPNPAMRFGAKTLLPELDGYSSADVSADNLEVFISDQSLLFRAEKGTPADPFSAPTEITELNAIGGGASPAVSFDKRTLFYGDKFGNNNLWFTERLDRTSPFDSPQTLPQLDPAGIYVEWAPSISASDLQLYYTSNKDTNLAGHLYVADRRRIKSPWRNPRKVETPSVDANGDYLPRSQEPSISRDGTELFFHAPQGDGSLGLYKVTRCPTEIDQDYDRQTLDIDCNDIEPRAGSGREEVCDFVDNECDGVVDGPVRPGEVSSFPVNIDLFMSKSSAGRLNFSWENMRSCATAYNIYEGTIGNYYSHTPLICHITSAVPSPDGERLRFATMPSGGSRYYLVNASNMSGEGTTGFGDNGEHDPSLTTCGPF